MAPSLSPYEPPADDKIIVWGEVDGKPKASTMSCSRVRGGMRTYREFVNVVGEQVAQTAVQQYRIEQQ